MLCHYCGKKAIVLCDGPLAFLSDNGQHYNTPTSERERGTRPMQAFTCDRPMCRSCVGWSSTIFACGKDGYIDSHDLCRKCHVRQLAGGRPKLVQTTIEGKKMQRAQHRALSIIQRRVSMRLSTGKPLSPR